LREEAIKEEMSASFVYCATCGAANSPDAAVCFACGNPPLIAISQAPANAPSTSLLAPHSLLKQRYRLLAQIGKGGFGAVYQAEDTELGNRKVAVKEMSQRGLTPEELQEATQAFRNEALLLAGLTHPNLPRIYEQFSEGGRWYLVMDFIEGETLEARLSRAPGGRLPIQEVLRIGVQLCTVLDYLHTRQPPIIFRDLKPANMMLTADGHLYLIDFGIARHFKPGQTRDTVAFGSAGYAAPEQYGKAQTTTQSDIYSLGATLHQLLSGSAPSNSPFLFAPLHLDEPDGLEALIMQMLETDQAKRPASMARIRQDLERMADDLVTGRKRQRPVITAASSSGGNALKPLVLYRGHFDKVQTLAWSPDGRYIASGGNDLSVQIWESASGKKLWHFPESNRVHSLAWSPDGEQLAWVSETKEVHLWKADTGDFSQLTLRRVGFFNRFLALAWSPDGSCLAAGGMGKTVEIWEVKTGKHLLTYSGHKRFFEDSLVYALAWSPDGEWIASASADATIHVWEVATCHQRCTYRGYRSGYAGGVAWSPDGQHIASAGEKAAVHVWDAASGMQRQMLTGHVWAVNAVAWSPDGRYLASGSKDQTVRVWDVAAVREALVYNHRKGEVNAIAWSSDSTRLASAGDDQTVHIWQVR
jgi:WD40 repeat protein/tRNA A-37 threonylcarbamoyl transferase component Bud32